MNHLLTFSIPKAESYFQIPDDLESLEKMTVLEYLRNHVWISYDREKECRKIYFQLLKENYGIMKSMKNIETKTDELLPIALLGTALISLLNVSITEDIVDELLQALDILNLKFQFFNFSEWCGISSFAERMLFAGPFKCSTLELADFKFLKDHGEWYDISLALRNVFEIVDYTHKMPKIQLED